VPIIVRWWLAPLLLVPLAAAVYGWRAGVDVDDDGLRVRRLLGTRPVPWSRVDVIAARGRRVVARLTDGREIVLPVVTPADLRRLVERTGSASVDQPATGPAQ